MPQQARQTAFKVWISDLVNNHIVKQEGEWEPSYISVKDKKVSRVNLIASVVMKYENGEKTYSNLALDDGSSQIRVKTWREDTRLLENVNIGDIILVIGRPREYNSEVYIAPEIVKKVENPSWMKIRKIELEKEYGKPVETKKELPQEQPSQGIVVKEETIIDTPTESDRQKILNLIEKNTSDEGAELTKVTEESGLGEERANQLIQDLIREGEVFEQKPGKLRII